MTATDPTEPLDGLHWHELMDRISLLSQVWSDHVTEHPAAKADPALFQKLDALGAQLFEAYDAVANVRFNMKP